MDLTQWVYDIEVYHNFFCANFVRAEESLEDTRQFTVWYDPFDENEPIDEILELLKFLAEDNFFVGFNSVGYDDIILHKALDLMGSSPKEFCSTLKELSDRIINNEVRKVSDADRVFYSLDLWRLWHFNNRARSMSLKAVEAAIGFHNIQELPIDPGQFVSEQEANDLIEYCWNDVNATKKFLWFKKPEVQEDTQAMIELREVLMEEYHYNFLNASNSSIGERIFLDYMSKALNLPPSVLRQWKTERDQIIVNDIILDYVEFDAPEFQGVLDQYREMLLGPKDKVSIDQAFGGMVYTFALGGLHAVVAGTHEPEDHQMILSVDVKTNLRPNRMNCWKPKL